jgi:hypothetical protein
MKKGFMSLLLLSIAFSVFAEEHLTGKMLIMGWRFEENDTSLQTNIAIDAIMKYAEASKYQMNSYEEYNPSCRVELYQEKHFYDYESFKNGYFIYINTKSEGDYHNRYMEINFYIVYDGLPSKCKLVFNYNNYRWLKNNDEKDMWELIMNGESAYDFFVSEIEKLRR